MEKNNNDKGNQLKTENHNKQQQEEKKLSICDIMKEDTSEVIKKVESTMPSMFQNYSDLYTGYLHMLDDVFGTCYIAEKEFFDKLNIDQGVLRQIKSNSESMKKHYIENIEMSAKFFEQYVKMRISATESFDNYAHMMMESYSKMLSQFNKSLKTPE
ncbi:MAG: hypothetical protein ACR2LL_04655 [Nitrosopumilus sp.]|uniref:hypothetical protein n=1 Tax=Nitrosopumilus sp. TaxID=2024843 RepID=UPI00292D2CC0|nr:hypothetical protein [Nitrosopumilus sp.]